MLNLFPVQFLAPLAYFLLRVVLGLVFLKMGRSQFQKGAQGRLWLPAIASSLLGFMFILGIYTQIAALGGVVIALASRFPYFRDRGFSYFDATTALLVGVISLSLFVTGGGPFGFDLPI